MKISSGEKNHSIYNMLYWYSATAYQYQKDLLPETYWQNVVSWEAGSIVWNIVEISDCYGNSDIVL